jgi:hypothetical protein
MFGAANTAPRLSVDMSDQTVPVAEPLVLQALYQHIV